MVSAARPGARRTGRPARGRRRSVADPAAGRLSARHLSLVFGRPAGAVVVARIRAKCSFPAEFRCSRSLAKTLRNRGFEVTFDRDFAAVVRCLRGAARTLHRAPGSRPKCTPPTASCTRGAMPTASRCGWTASWSAGCTACSLGSVFFGESMFSRERDASKVALARLVERARCGGTPTHRLPATYPAFALAGQQADAPSRIQRAGCRSPPPGPTCRCFRHPENCSPKALFWQNSPPSRVPQVTDVERRCDSDGRRSRRDFA